MWKNIGRMNDEGLDVRKMKDREEVATRSELGEDSGIPWVFNSSGTHPANTVRYFRAAVGTTEEAAPHLRSLASPLSGHLFSGVMGWRSRSEPLCPA